ncbi:hypothetical protein BH10PSE14_BH10PSE14_03710 [soil metagenome]|uniref:hypothetical protein n=1 Tax=Parasphingomonas halimpatiens TaxID=3096162 RepID=UPI002FC64623
MSTILPDGFAALEPFAATWAISGSVARAAVRGSSDAADRAAFYDAAKDELLPALAYLDGKPIAHLEERDRRLLDMMLALAHVSLTVEILGDQEAAHAAQRRHMRIIRSPAGA